MTIANTAISRSELMSLSQLFRTDVVGDIMLLELRDAVSGLADHSILTELEEIRQERRDIGVTKLVIDLAQAPFFGSSLLELIRVLWNDLMAKGGRLVLCNPSPVGREVLEVAKFDQIWPLVETRAEAFALLGPARNVGSWPHALQELMAKYDNGPGQLRDALADLPPIELRTPAPPGQWSALQIVCHIADFEILAADRMKRIVAENHPTLLNGDPDLFAAKLAYPQRDPAEEVELISALRRSVSRILKTLSAEDFERTGQHSTDGSITLARLLERTAGHLPHHVHFLVQKRSRLLNRPAK
jgi:anti-anti-sigma factor